jgi:putative pyruvate formate lyase activating enzyme
MNDFNRLWVWRDPALARGLEWYRAVAGNRRPAKFRIARTIPITLDADSANEEALCAELERCTPQFLALWQDFRSGTGALAPVADGPSLLCLCAALARRMLAHCNFCRWNCRIDRAAPDRLGACKLAADSRVSSHFHHRGEELVYRGTEGSGTIFFTSCNMRCAFCQNGDISTDKDNGEVTSARTLAAMAWQLRMEGCHNINWVGGDPTIHLHTIVAAIALLGSGFVPEPADARAAVRTRADGSRWYAAHTADGMYAGAFNAPMLWNSNFYMSDETMRLLRLLIDVWLPDFKFGPGRCAIELARTPRYWETVTEHLVSLRDWGEDFTIRHLVMPGHVECCTLPVLDWIAERMPTAPVNIMDQYHPDNFCDPANPQFDRRRAGLARCTSRGELELAFSHARRRGLAFETLSLEKRVLA